MKRLSYILITMAYCFLQPLGAQSLPDADSINVADYDTPFVKAAKHSLALLKEGDYETLEAELDRLLLRAQVNPSKEYDLRMGYEVFTPDMGELSDNLTAWVTAHPKSYQAHLAKAVYTINEAWEARGRGYSNTVSEDNMQTFRQSLTTAKQLIEDSIELQPDNNIAYYFLGRTCGVGGAQCAAEVAEQFADNNVTGYYAHRIILNFFQPRWGGSRKALAWYTDYLAHTYSLDRYPHLKPLKGFRDYHQAVLYENKKEYEKALQENSKALVAGEDLGYLEQRIGLLVKLERLDEADEVYQRRLKSYPFSGEIDPEDEYYVTALVEQAYHLTEDGNFSGAKKPLKQIISYAPQSKWSLESYGRILLEEKAFQEAEELFWRANKFHPDSRYTARMLDWLLLPQNRLDEIVTIWENYLALKPDDPVAHLEVTGTYRKMNDMKNAYLHLNRACDLGNNQACTYANRQ